MICKYCGKEFVKKHNSQKYCSGSCSHAAKKLQDKHNNHRNYISSLEKKPIITATCEYCGEQFIKTHGNQKYCSKYCANHRKLEQNADSRMKSYHKNKKRGGDKFWGLGTGGLGPHRYEDFDLEFQKVQNELGRLGLPAK